MSQWNVCLPPLHEKNLIKPKWGLWGKHSCHTKLACKHAKTPDTHSGTALIYCRHFDLMRLMSAIWHETAKNPPLLQGGAPRTNLGKDTTPNTPPSVPLIMWNYTVEEKSYDVRDEHMLHAQRSVFHTRQQWYLSNFIGIMHISHPSLGWAVMQIKPSIYWTSLVFHFSMIHLTIINLECCNVMSKCSLLFVVKVVFTQFHTSNNLLPI